MLANTLRLIIATFGVLALVWLWGAGQQWPWRLLAIAGIAPAMLGLLLWLVFLLARWGNRKDPAPTATTGTWTRAFACELVVAIRVFFWRQPFRSNCLPDKWNSRCGSLHGVIFLHGFVCNRGLWMPWMEELQAEGRPCVALNLEPVFGSIDGYAPQIDAAVEAMFRTTGLAPVLVCHSMGGLAARAWLRAAGDEGVGRVRAVFTIGTPHRGTWLGRFSPVVNGREMRLGSRWVEGIGVVKTNPVADLFVCWYSNCDNIVFPASTATLAGADNRLAAGLGHVQMALDSGVRKEILAHIRSLQARCSTTTGL